jgi:hypothetical protein
MKDILDENKSALFYQANLRRYLIKEITEGTTITMANKICYCPWCGKRLPEPLGGKIEEILEKEYHLKEPWSSDKKTKLIPPEFQTDEWWKKRGL